MSGPIHHGDQYTAGLAPPAPINPYAPSTTELDSIGGIEIHRVSTIAVILSTIGGVTVSGGIFGLGIVLTSGTASMAPFAFVIGCIFAFIGAIVVAPLILTARVFLSASAGHWTSSQIHLFGALSGGFTGFLCIAVPARFEPISLAVGLIPGVVGGVVTTLFLIPLARRVKQRQKDFTESIDYRRESR